jgi:YkoY family integral membrane protein
VDHFLPSGLDISSGLSQSLLLLPVLVALEAVLSADNAIALAAIARGLGDEERQRQALNIGLVAAFALRVLLIVTASWVTQFWQFELAGAGYLLWLSVQYFWPKSEAEEEEEAKTHNRFESLWQAIPLIAVTDLAFSLDSVTTAIAISKETWLVVTGGAIGVIMLRFMAGLFIRWLKEFEHLEDAGYVAVALVGLRLLLRVVDLVLPEVVMIALIMVIFAWGFSKRSLPSAD